MSVRLRVDGGAWRTHLRTVAQQAPGLVPVAKGNGYGYGLGLLAAEAQRLGVDSLAVGTLPEVAAVRDAFQGSIVVLQPWRPFEPGAHELLADPRVIHTVSRVDDLQAVTASGHRPRVVLELLTSMRRHGLSLDDLGQLGPIEGVELVGWTIHLPMPAATGGNLAEAERLGAAAAAVRRAPLWFSHVTAAEYERLRGTDNRLRMGTNLWLGAASSRRTSATVLDVHAVSRGDRIGYWQRPMPADGHVVVLSGGTAHGVGLEAPTSAATARQRLVSVVSGSMEAVGLAKSPFTIGGKKRWFVEPPHMQSSLVFLPGSAPAPAVGDEVPVELRLTTATVDEVVLDN